ncbi:MAG: helix-turn-helix domain-containing protein [Gaiellaceae bacterium]
MAPWPELATLQGQYAATANEFERRAIGVEFERAVRSLDPADVDTVNVNAPSPTMLAIMNAEPEWYDPEADARASERRARALWARDLCQDGLSLRAIGERIGTSPSTVSRLLAELEA